MIGFLLYFGEVEFVLFRRTKEREKDEKQQGKKKMPFDHQFSPLMI
jgi:hypothetical protein